MNQTIEKEKNDRLFKVNFIRKNVHERQIKIVLNMNKTFNVSLIIKLFNTSLFLISLLLVISYYDCAYFIRVSHTLT